MKFFVYANKADVKDSNVKDRAIYFVPEKDMRDWASKFNPGIMEYCGVSIEAEHKDEARKTFVYPLDNDGLDKMLAEQEPLLTRECSRRFQESRERVSKATMNLMVNRMASLWEQIDDMLRAMAQLHALKHGDINEDLAYQIMKKEWLKRYNDL
jgi:hypothetical protein